MSAFNWKQYEEVVFRAACEAARKIMDQHSGAFYSVAFDEFYAECEGMIKLPFMAANTTAELGDDKDDLWSTPDWRWTMRRYSNKDVTQFHRALQKEAVSKDEEHWHVIYKRFIQAFINVAKQLSAELKKHPHATRDFAAFVFVEDCEDDIEVIRKCTTPAKFKKLFPWLQEEVDRRRALGTSSFEDKLATYRKELRKHETQILKLRERAIPMLLDALGDPKQAWSAADILGPLGIPDERVIAALRTRAQNGHELNFHDTIALELLGDTEFLLKLAGDAKARKIAIRGITIRYSSWASDIKQIPLDYRPIERLLEDQECKGSVEKFYDSPKIVAADIDEALRGLQSKHGLIREHATCVLCDPRLGKEASKRILPALAARLRDRRATVRRLAILSLGRWKKLGQAYSPEVRKLLKDPDPNVASYAESFLQHRFGRD